MECDTCGLIRVASTLGVPAIGEKPRQSTWLLRIHACCLLKVYTKKHQQVPTSGGCSPKNASKPTSRRRTRQPQGIQSTLRLEPLALHETLAILQALRQRKPHQRVQRVVAVHDQPCFAALGRFWALCAPCQTVST